MLRTPHLPKDTAAVRTNRPIDVKCLHRLSIKSVDGEGSLQMKNIYKHLKKPAWKW
jgi:hypothetical protein